MREQLESAWERVFWLSVFVGWAFFIAFVISVFAGILPPVQGELPP